jgi:arginase
MLFSPSLVTTNRKNGMACNRSIDMIGYPMDLGAGRRGVDMGPTALRIAGIQEKLECLGYSVNDLGDICIHSRQDLKISDPRLKYVDEIATAAQILADQVEKSLAQDHFPLCLGGDHGVAIGSIAGVSAFCRKNGRTPGVIWIDAHADMNTEKTTPSGNIHGMALAIALGLGDPRLTHLNGYAPKIQPEHSALIGIRKIDRLEKQTLKNRRLPVYTMSDIDRKGIDFIIGNILKNLKAHVDHIHVSFDVDSVDPLIAPGVGTPVSGGLTYREIHLLMETIAECGCMSSMDVAEVNPILDNRNTSAKLAADIVASSMGMRIL